MLINLISSVLDPFHKEETTAFYQKFKVVVKIIRESLVNFFDVCDDPSKTLSLQFMLIIIAENVSFFFL